MEQMVTGTSMKYIVSVLMRYRYAVMVIMMISMPAFLLTSHGRLPDEKSFLSLLGYLGMIALVEFNDPGPHRGKSYLFMAMIPLITLALISMVSLLFIRSDIVQHGSSVASLLLLWMASAALLCISTLHTAWIDRPRVRSLYVRATVIALGIASTLFALVLAVILLPWFVNLAFFLLVPLLVWELISFRPIIHPVYRFLVVMSLVLLVAISIGGWRWLELMDDGLNRFTGEDRLAAQEFLEAAYPLCDDNPAAVSVRYRVLKDSEGSFYLQGYTWWRFRVDNLADGGFCN